MPQCAVWRAFPPPPLSSVEGWAELSWLDGEFAVGEDRPGLGLLGGVDRGAAARGSGVG